MTQPTRTTQTMFWRALLRGISYVHGRLEGARDLTPHLEMSEHSYGPSSIQSFGDPNSRLIVGKYTSISDTADFLLSGNHHLEWISTYPFRIKYGLSGAYTDGQPFSKGDIVVGNDVWIGWRAIILSGVTIGDGAVIAAGTVVTKDVVPYSIVSGNPGAPLSHRRFNDRTCDALLRISWWNWNHPKVLAHVDQLSTTDVANFVALHDQALTTTECPACNGP
ncbi:MAG: CatB-related O-acetyltransferase [Acidimicrobiales bacterium]